MSKLDSGAIVTINNRSIDRDHDEIFECEEVHRTGTLIYCLMAPLSNEDRSHFKS